MGTADEILWPLASSPEMARWAAQAVERHNRHMALIIMSRAATWPGREAPFPPQALGLARHLYEATARRLDALGRPSRPDGLGAHSGARPVSPYPHLAGWAPAEGGAPRQDRRLAMAYRFGTAAEGQEHGQNRSLTR